jgi:hypothetical protein
MIFLEGTLTGADRKGLQKWNIQRISITGKRWIGGNRKGTGIPESLPGR